jgi:tetratricopeptide (TPR) repeat protein
LSLAKEINDQAGLALACFWMGRLADDSSANASTVSAWLDQALTMARSVDDKPLTAEVLYIQGNIAVNHGNPVLGRQYFEESLAIAQSAGLQSRLHRPLQGLGRLAMGDCDLSSARKYYEAAAVILRKQGDKFNLLRTLCGLIETISRQGDYPVARACLSEVKEISRSVGEDYWIHSFGYAEARYLLTIHDDAGAVQICRQMYAYAKAVDGGTIKSIWPAVNILMELAWSAAQAGPPAKALRLSGALEAAARQAGLLIYPIVQTELARNIGLARQGLDDAAVDLALVDGRAMSLEKAIEYALA